MKTESNYKWYVLALTALTCAFAVGVPAVSLAVLFQEIVGDLHLNLVQVGLLWSIGSLPAILTSPLSGMLIDRFGPKRVMLVGTFLVAVTAASRGLAPNFTALLFIIIVIGSLVPFVTTSSYKIAGLWFAHQQLGLANGLLAMGMALGLLLGSLLSATVMSPWLGGWRNVMYFYGALALVFCLPWYFTRARPETAGSGPVETQTTSMGQAMQHVMKLKNIWLLGVTLMGITGCLQGLSGYVSLYLRGLGWPAVSADGALSLLSAMSMICILPIALWSDRLGSRKMILAGMLLMIASGTGLLSVANGWMVWAAIGLVGMVRDGATAVLMTMVIETDGVGPVYAGTASGFVMFFFFAGNLLAPPVGNQLAEFLPGLPFVFWAGLALLGLISLSFAKGAGPAKAIAHPQATVI